jgi:hypothetical protein
MLRRFRFTKIKIFLSVITISFVLFLTGTFFPNPYTKHLIRKDVETFFTNWANELGLQEPVFEYNNDMQFVQAVRRCIDWVNFETPRLLVLGQELDSKALVKTLKAYSTTKNYAERVNHIIDIIRKQEQKVGEIEIRLDNESKR